MKEQDLALTKNFTCTDGYLVNRKLSIQDIDVKGVIGKGSFGKIFGVGVRGSDKIFAMKSYKKKNFLSSSLVRFLFIEKKIMVNFDYPFLVKLYYAFQNRDRLFVLMDYCEKRDLTKQVLKMDELQVKILACELVLAIKALHDRGVIHRDIKPDNVFICADGHVKLGDFGLAKENVTKGSLHHTFCGSIAYLPPEVVKKTGHTKSIDWYLLGELLYELVAGVPPFYGVGKEALMDNILHKELDLKALQVSDSFRDLLSKLLCRDIHSRLGSRYDGLEVMEHHYFVGIDWNKVYAKQYPLFKPEALDSYKLKRDSASELEANCSSSDEMNLPYWSFVR
jgi:protein-serine/threonine kinase